jgi:type I restriction-modification system DNA methylase subunit
MLTPSPLGPSLPLLLPAQVLEAADDAAEGEAGAEGDDLLGDAYEYLMRHFATESGKSKGQFYTPAEVSRIMAKVIGAGSAKSSAQTIHDPTCGSGSLLLKAHDEARGATGHAA